MDNLKNERKDQNLNDIISLSESESELRLVIDNMPSLITYVDSSKKYR